MTILQQTESPRGTKQREEWVDFLRGAGIILMIMGHTKIWSPIIRWIYGFHMPLFFILSGYLFSRQKWTAAGFKRFIITRFRNYIIPYFIWCGICLIIIFPLMYYSYHNGNLLIAIIQNLGWIMTSVKVDGVFLPQNCTPLWFLTCLFISQLVFYWLVRCKGIWQFLISACFFAINYLMNYYKMLILPWHFEVALIGSVFMLVGYYAREKKLIDRIKNPIFAVAGFAVSSIIILLNGMADMYYRNYGNDLFVFTVGSVVMCYIFMWACKSLKTFYFSKVFCNLGMYSIIAMGLNYSINRYVRSAYKFFSMRTGVHLRGVEYGLTLINIFVCLVAIWIYKKLVTKNPKYSVLIGKYVRP